MNKTFRSTALAMSLALAACLPAAFAATPTGAIGNLNVSCTSWQGTASEVRALTVTC